VPTRYNPRSQQRFGVPPLETGFEGSSSSGDLHVPSFGIEDTDRALFEFFNSELPLMVNTREGVRRVPVIFTSGEKWALLRKATPRDKNGTLIIPAIVMGRTSIEQNVQNDVTGRGMNQNTGSMQIKRRLNGRNRSHQSLINRLLVKNQSNVALNNDDELLDDQISTSSEIGDMKEDPTVRQNGLLLPDLGNEVWETIVLPQPQFYTATYEVIVWCQYITQMNEIITSIISSFLPQGNSWRIDSNKGYWVIATVDGNSYSPQNNFDNMANDERTIKYTFNITVPSYILAGESPGQPIAVRRYVSNPSISFSISSFNDPDAVAGEDVFLGADDPTIPSSLKASKRRDQRETNDTLLYKTGENDPAIKQSRQRIATRYRTFTGVDSNGKKTKRYLKIKNQNAATGETIYSSISEIDGVAITTIED